MFLRTPIALILVALMIPGTGHALNMANKPEPASSKCLVKASNGKQIVKNTANPFKNESAVKIEPHRALYTMSLASAKNSSNITGVSGRMAFEWSDDCDGWAVQQHLQLHFSYAEGDESDLSSTVISWEAKDGSRYNFNVRRTTNGKETENYRGRVTMESDEGVAKYTTPKDKPDIMLAEGTIFPSAHTKLILEKALEGEKFFSKRVFDGSDEDGQADVSAFIGEPTDKIDVSDNLKQNPLLKKKAWPVRLAFFKPTTETGESDYEMDIVLQENGVARSMLIDYGDFSVTGTLSDIEPVPVVGCKE